MDRATAFIFSGENPKKKLPHEKMLKVLKVLRPGLTVHGFRSTFKDWASEQTAYANEVSEIALAHKVGDKVENAYRRTDLVREAAPADGGLGEILHGSRIVKKQDQISKAVKLLKPSDTAAVRKYVGRAITYLNAVKSENHHLEDLAAKKSRKSLEAFQKAIDRARAAFTNMPDGMRTVFDRSIEIEGINLFRSTLL